MNPTTLFATVTDAVTQSPDDVPAVGAPSHLEHQLAQIDKAGRERLQQRRQRWAHWVRSCSESRVSTRHLGPLPPAVAVQVYEGLVRQLARQVLDGAGVHRRLRWWLRALPGAVAVLDALVLYLFCCDLLNVQPGDRSGFGLAALALAALGTAVAYAWMDVTGDRLRARRRPQGEICWRAVDSGTWMMVLICLVVSTCQAVLMYSRILDLATAATAAYLAADQVAVLAVVFTVFSGCANLAMLAVHALDGSELGEQVRQLGKALRARDASMRRRRLLLRGDQRPQH